MANCNEHFKQFNQSIRLTDAKRKDLKTSRKELRRKVRAWFKENKPNEEQPKFFGQGSLSMDTIINPIPRKEKVNGEDKPLYYYDIDDGIYFEGNKSIADRPSPATYHNWVVEAVKGHTGQDPVDKNTCVRTIFADGHNIDQPIYYKQSNTPQLAHKRDGYIDSDPRAFTEWFNNGADQNEQLRRMARYIKAWLDKRDFDNPYKSLPSGMIMTILIKNNASYHATRDDIAFKETLVNIQSALNRSFVCFRPTTPSGEDLLKSYTQKDYFMTCLNSLIEDAKKALAEKNIRKATEYWRKHLSERFPLGEDKEEASNVLIGLASLITPSTKPYCEE
jgi:hypothetical protein